MTVIELTEYNISDFTGYISEDYAENIGRQFYRGLVAVEGSEAVGSIIRQYKNAQEDRESFIEWFRAADRETAKSVFAAYPDISCGHDREE